VNTSPRGTLFKPSLTDQGILLEVYDPETEKVEVPSWAKR